MEGSNSQDTLEKLVPKPKRGKTRAEKWKKKRASTKGKVVVQLPYCLRRVVGPNSQQFTTETSYLVRQHCPLNVKKWSEIDQNVKDMLMITVKEMYVLPNEAHVEGAVWTVIMRAYRNWRFNLHKIYLKFPTDRERISKCPSEIDPEQWKWLVKYWGSEEFRRKSEVNTQNRSLQTMLACVGTVSIARIATEMREARNDDEEIDQEPEYLRLFRKERKKKDGTWVDVQGEEAYNKLLKLHEEQLESYGVDNLNTEEAYTKVLGNKSGHIRGMGQGPRPLKCARRNGEYASQPIISESEFQARLKTEIEVNNKKRDDELHQTIIAIQKKFEDDLRKLKEELTVSHTSEIATPMNLPPIRPPESSNTSLAAQPTDVGNYSNVHKTIDYARGEKENILFDKSSNIRVGSQPKNSASIPQSQPAKVTSIAQQNKTLGVNTVKPALKPLNCEMPTTLTARQNDEAGMVCVVCQINVPNLEAYKNHLSDIKHKMTMEKFSTKTVGGGHGKIVITRRIKKEK